MKKYLYILLLFLTMFVSTNAEEYSNEGSYTISLTCEVAPSYCVKLPKSITVNENTTQLNFEVKGDLYNNQNLYVVFDSSTNLTYGTKTEIVTIQQNKTCWTNSELSNEYISNHITLSHNTLSAGNWSGTLNVSISLSEV